MAALNSPARSDDVFRSMVPNNEDLLSAKGGYTTTIQTGQRSPSSSLIPSLRPDPSPHTLEAIAGEGKAVNIVTLPPQDTGFGAWSYVLSAFTMFVVVWGLPEAWPIFQAYLSEGKTARHPDSSIIPLLAPGMSDIVEGILFQILPRHSKHRRSMVICGITIIILSFFLASCAETAWELVLTQGLMFSIGGIMLNFVHVSIFAEWFNEQRGRAMGYIWLGWRVGGLVFPLICQSLLESQGYEQTLLVLIAPVLALLLPCIFTFRGRYAVSHAEEHVSKAWGSSLKVLRSGHIWFYLLVTVLFSAVANVPTIFMPRFAIDLDLSRSTQAIASSLRILSAMFVVYIFGFLSDAGYYRKLMAASAIATSLVHLAWGLVKNGYQLYAYAIAVGFSSGGYDICLFGIFSEIAHNDDEYYMSLYSMFSFIRGLATVTVGTVGVKLLRISPEVLVDQYALGKYQYLIIYASFMTMTSGLITALDMYLN